MGIAGVSVSIIAAIAGFSQYVPSILYGTLSGLCYFFLLHLQFQRGIRFSYYKAVMNVNNGLLSRVCVVIAFVVFGAHVLPVTIPAVLAGLFIPVRIVFIWQVIVIACKKNVDEDHLRKEAYQWKK